MNPSTHALQVGARRGWLEFRHGLADPQDLGFYLVMGAGLFWYMFVNRDDVVEGTASLLMPTVFMPSVLGGLVAFGGVISVAYALAAEREDGTLLRAKAIPHGMSGYLVGHVVRTSLETFPALAVVLVPGLFVFDDLMSGGAGGWVTFSWVLALGLVASIPIGMIIGGLVKRPSKVGTWGMLPIIGLVSISGIFYPITALPDWIQTVAQVFPIYWLGLGMRSAFLPDSAAAWEIGESWRTLETVGVLGLWAVAGVLIAPIVLRRMARRESGSMLEARREKAMQRIS